MTDKMRRLVSPRSEGNGRRSPTLSVKSLTLKPSSPRLPKVKFNSSPSHMDRLHDHAPIGNVHYLVAVHRLVLFAFNISY